VNATAPDRNICLIRLSLDAKLVSLQLPYFANLPVWRGDLGR